MSVVVGSFEHGSKKYVQLIYVSEDDRVEIIDDGGEIVLIFTADCYIQLEDKYIGRISQCDNEITFCFNAQEDLGQIKTGISPRLTDAYFRAEAIATKYFLDHKEELVK